MFYLLYFSNYYFRMIYGCKKYWKKSIQAIKNIKLNADIHCLDISIKKGSVFDPIQINNRFDLIFWNHPFYCDNALYRTKNKLKKETH